MTTYNIGDRVRRIGPHIFAGDIEYPDGAECNVGDVGTVVDDWRDGDYSVTWDHNPDGRSTIVGTSLELVSRASTAQVTESQEAQA